MIKPDLPEVVRTRALMLAEDKRYDEAIGDLVSYLQWMGEPAQNSRVRIGVWVLMFLLFFTAIAWRLNASFWKDVK